MKWVVFYKAYVVLENKDNLGQTFMFKQFLSPQVPGNLSSRPEYVVLAYKLPYNENLAPEELEKEDKTDYFGKVTASASANERRQ